MADIDNTITITAMNRPHKLRAMLASLTQCDLDGWHIFAAIEPGRQQREMANIFSTSLPADQLTITLNKKRLGIRENPHAALKRAFAAGAQFNLCLEDDFILAPDALHIAKWYKKNHREHWTALNLMAGTCGSAGNLSDPSHPNLVFESCCFNSIGVGFTKSDWACLSRYFGTPLRKQSGPTIFDSGWDWALFGKILLSPQLKVVHPVSARCTHDGEVGTHCIAEFQEQAFGRLEITPFRETPANFDLVEIGALPTTVASHAKCQQDLANLHLERMQQQGVELPYPQVYDPPNETSMSPLRQKYNRLKKCLTSPLRN